MQENFEIQPDGIVTPIDPEDRGDPIHIIEMIMFRLRDLLDEYEFAEIERIAKRALPANHPTNG